MLGEVAVLSSATPHRGHLLVHHPRTTATPVPNSATTDPLFGPASTGELKMSHTSDHDPELMPEEEGRPFEPSLDYYRLRWLVQDGPIWENIHVLDDGTNAYSTQTPFQNEAGELHEIAARPVSTPPITTLTVKVDQMDGLQMWKMYYDSDDCDSPRVMDPESAPKLELTAGDGKEFISIGDYVSAVNPWLVALRPQYLREIGLIAGGEELPADKRLWVSPNSPGFIFFIEDGRDFFWKNIAELYEEIMSEMQG